jgi:hypothetical protein
MWFYFRLFIKPTDIPPVFGGMDRPHPRTKTLRGRLTLSYEERKCIFGRRHSNLNITRLPFRGPQGVLSVHSNLTLTLSYKERECFL